MPGGKPTLRAVVTEAKYVGLEGAAEARRTSKQQLRQTVQRIEEALFGDPGRLDRDLWLSRIADLLLDGTTALGQSDALEAVRDGIRQGVTPIDLRGYSHIFVSGLAEPAAPGEQEPIADVPHGLQEVFTREDVRKLLKAYEARTRSGGCAARTGRPASLGGHRVPQSRSAGELDQPAHRRRRYLVPRQQRSKGQLPRSAPKPAPPTVPEVESIESRACRWRATLRPIAQAAEAVWRPEQASRHRCR